MKETFNAEITLKESTALLSEMEAAGRTAPAVAPVEAVTSPAESTVEAAGVGAVPRPAPTPEPEPFDGTYVWRWGAWRDPVTDKAYVPPTPVAPHPVPVYGTSSGTCPHLIVETFGSAARAACAVAECESGFNWNATGAAGERGIFQIHPVHGAYSSYDPYTNVSYAYQLSRGGTDWGHWTCKPW